MHAFFENFQKWRLETKEFQHLDGTNDAVVAKLILSSTTFWLSRNLVFQNKKLFFTQNLFKSFEKKIKLFKKNNNKPGLVWRTFPNGCLRPKKKHLFSGYSENQEKNKLPAAPAASCARRWFIHGFGTPPVLLALSSMYLSTADG